MAEAKALTAERRFEILKIRNCVGFLDSACSGGIAATQEAFDELLAHIDSLTSKLAQAEKDMATFGIVELAARNPNVSSYVEHWEARATQAEQARDVLARANREWVIAYQKLRDCRSVQALGGQTIQANMDNTVYVRVPHSIFNDAIYSQEEADACPAAKAASEGRD